MKLRAKNQALLAFGALALGAAVAGCSSGPTGLGFDDSGAVGGDDGGASSSGRSSGASSGGSGSSGSSGGGSGSSTGGGSGSSSGSGGGNGGSSGGSSGSSSGGSGGSSSGSGGGADAGNQSTPDAGGTRPDATAGQDANGIADTGTNPGPDSGLCADQAVWIDPQNAARAAVNAGEPPLVCDPIAVQVALNYAKTCVWAHNPNRSAQYVALGGTGGLGENIASATPTESIAGAVASWVNEGVNYNHATNTCAAGKVCGHYTQVVWKATTRVGCAKVSCTTGSPFPANFGTNWDLSVCDYNPPGNVGTQSPY